MEQSESFRNINSLESFSHSKFSQYKNSIRDSKELKCDMAAKCNSGEEGQENNSSL